MVHDELGGGGEVSLESFQEIFYIKLERFSPWQTFLLCLIFEGRHYLKC
jgi:hypothetical protein